MIAGDDITRDRAQPDLRAAKILQDRDLTPALRPKLPDCLELRRNARHESPCEKLSRKTSTPASTIWRRIAGSLEAGPTVATILVRTFPNCSLWNDAMVLRQSVLSD